MSYGLRIAIGLYLLTSGNAGYERFAMQGNVWAAVFVAMLALAGLLILSSAINSLLRALIGFNRL